MAKISAAQLKTLSESLIKAGSQFKDYNFRHYVLRKTKEDFTRCQEQGLEGEQLHEFYQAQQDHLAIVQRQVIVQNMYFQQPIILEKQ